MTAREAGDAVTEAASSVEPQQKTPGAERLKTACGRVTAVPPAPPDVYWRIEYNLAGKRVQTTGGRTLGSATKKVEAVLRILDGEVGPNSSTKVGVVLDSYIEHLEAHAAPNHAEKTIPDLRKALDAYRGLASSELASHHLRKACDAAATKSAGDHRKSRLSAFTKWGFAEGYFSQPQTHLLAGYKWTRPKGAPVRPTRDFTPAKHGEAGRFVTDDQVPLHRNIVSLAEALEELLPGRGELLVHVAYSAGLRAGELYALEDRAVDQENRHIQVLWQAESLSKRQLERHGRTSRRARPKGGKVRTTNFPCTTPTGYRLADAVGDRLERVEWEHRRDLNPKRLLFPAPKGNWFWHSSFTTDYLHPAARAAGWEFIEWTEPNGQERKMLRHYFHTLRHRFARDRIDLMHYTVSDLQAVGGWDSAQVVWERYYGSSKDQLQRADDKLRTWERRAEP